MLVAAVLVSVILIIVFNRQVMEAISDFLAWVKENPVSGPVLVALLYFICTLLFIPGPIITWGTGLAFYQAYGSVWQAVVIGSVTIFIGAYASSIVAFLMGRYVFRDKMEQFAQENRIMMGIERAIKDEGLRILILIRMSPLFPFTTFNYAMGITSIRLRDYALGSLFLLPGRIINVFIGTMTGTIHDALTEDDKKQGATARILVVIVGLIFAIAAVIYISVLIRRYTEESLQSDGPQNHTDEVAAQAAAERRREQLRDEEESRPLLV